MIKKNIKTLVSHSDFLHILCIKLVFLLYRAKVNILLRKVSPKNEYVKSLPVLIKEERARVAFKESKVAHIIGSGWSLNKTTDVIDDKDFVIGFNFSPLSNLNLDIYFIEFGGYKCSEIADFHRMLAEKLVIPSGGNVYFKNIWEKKNDIEYMKNFIKDRYPLVKDFLVPCLGVENIRQSLFFCLNNESDFLAQMRSSTVTAVFFAYYLGFKKIVLHGIDFRGGYFFEQDDFQGHKDYSVIAKRRMYNKHLKAGDQQHPTAVRDVGLRQILPVLRDLLAQKGISLCAASVISPSSVILPIYSKD